LVKPSFASSIGARVSGVGAFKRLASGASAIVGVTEAAPAAVEGLAAATGVLAQARIRGVASARVVGSGLTSVTEQVADSVKARALIIGKALISARAAE